MAQRLEIIREILKGKCSGNLKEIAIKAVKVAFQSTGTVMLRRSAGPEPLDIMTNMTWGDLFEYWAELIGLLPEIGEGEDRGLAAEAVKLLPDAIAHYTSYAPDRGTKVFDMFIAQLLGQKLNANIADLAGSLAFAINGLRRNEKENAQRMAVLQSLLSQIAR